MSHWPKVLAESRGLREKHWVTDVGGRHWLRKLPRSSRPFEPAIEATILRLAAEVGIEAANGSVCLWDTDGGEQHGLAVLNFVDRAREELFLGSQLLRLHDREYDANAKWEHTTTRVVGALREREQAGQLDLVKRFVHILAFDAWIGNSDRHQENWGLIIGPEEKYRLAPMYDPASCLGAELQNTHALLSSNCPNDRLQTYIERCPSGFGDGKSGILLVQVVRELEYVPEWSQNIRGWLRAFSGAMPAFEQLLETVPLQWLPQSRKDLMLRLLRCRLRWLSDTVNA